MKRKIALLFAVTALLTACYDDYVKDYDFSAVYVAYQYDLRTFVVGEGMEFTAGAVLGGVISNDVDREVNYIVDDDLVTGNLAYYAGYDASYNFTAWDVMSGNSTNGSVSQSYVSDAIKASGIKKLTPLPKEYYTIDEPVITIKKGRHTGTMTIKADSLALLADGHVSPAPYYALGYRVVSAEADTVLWAHSYEVIAVRIENKFFGNYYHGGVSTVVDAAGAEVSQDVYPTTIPAVDGSSQLYSLTTTSHNAVKTNFAGNGPGSVDLTFEGDAVTVSGYVKGAPVEDLGSSFNGAKLLQNRKLFLNYRYSNGDGTSTEVKDTLSFRNRIRDGVNEWQDENPSHYE